MRIADVACPAGSFGFCLLNRSTRPANPPILTRLPCGQPLIPATVRQPVSVWHRPVVRPEEHGDFYRPVDSLTPVRSGFRACPGNVQEGGQTPICSDDCANWRQTPTFPGQAISRPWASASPQETGAIGNFAGHHMGTVRCRLGEFPAWVEQKTWPADQAGAWSPHTGGFRSAGWKLSLRRTIIP